MKRVFLSLVFLAFAGGAQAQVVLVNSSAAPYNDLIVAQTRAMPAFGGYSASHQASVNLAGSVSLGGQEGVRVDAERAQPSYCSGATYLVLLKTVGALVGRGQVSPDERGLAALLVRGQRDGEGVWGRWNANGPGTARLFYETGAGENFTDFARARPGDFMKIFWNDKVGRREHGHSVVFLGVGNVNGVDSVTFWSSNLGAGYGEKTVPRSKISAAIFSRLLNPRALLQAGAVLPKIDPYLASLLSADSSQAEVRQNCGMR